MTDPTDESTADRLPVAVLVCLDAVTYAFTVALTTTVIAVSLAFVTGGGFTRVKYVLFVVGFLLLGYATVRLWPSSPSDLEDDHARESDAMTTASLTTDSIPASADQTRFQSFVRAMPPLRWLPAPPPTYRMSPPGKLFLGSLFVLLVSYLLEALFGF
ncbi:DUF7555 family protein [Halopiger djelfimassiliensis]|uniref:DUF7555 family protein n=1 Tax=Halopiger djelfimassiliensis TaxID=1293047 RepID=UPI00067832FB|nr:hypothetical protein [Halopiger djelfimassiliensis]